MAPYKKYLTVKIKNQEENMKFGKKSAFVLIVAGITALSMAGCGGGSSADEKYPEYVDWRLGPSH